MTDKLYQGSSLEGNLLFVLLFFRKETHAQMQIKTDRCSDSSLQCRWDTDSGFTLPPLILFQLLKLCSYWGVNVYLICRLLRGMFGKKVVPNATFPQYKHILLFKSINAP